MSDALIAYVKKLEASGFYGSVTFTFSKGQVILAETKQLLKPDTMKQITNQEETHSPTGGLGQEQP
jgi:hypothetical protein